MCFKLLRYACGHLNRKTTDCVLISRHYRSFLRRNLIKEPECCDKLKIDPNKLDRLCSACRSHQDTRIDDWIGPNRRPARNMQGTSPWERDTRRDQQHVERSQRETNVSKQCPSESGLGHGPSNVLPHPLQCRAYALPRDDMAIPTRWLRDPVPRNVKPDPPQQLHSSRRTSRPLRQAYQAQEPKKEVVTRTGSQNGASYNYLTSVSNIAGNMAGSPDSGSTRSFSEYLEPHWRPVEREGTDRKKAIPPPNGRSYAVRMRQKQREQEASAQAELNRKAAQYTTPKNQPFDDSSNWVGDIGVRENHRAPSSRSYNRSDQPRTASQSAVPVPEVVPEPHVHHLSREATGRLLTALKISENADRQSRRSGSLGTSRLSRNSSQRRRDRPPTRQSTRRRGSSLQECVQSACRALSWKTSAGSDDSFTCTRAKDIESGNRR